MILILGGVKSGKSSFALRKALEHPEPRALVATGEPIDEEMRARIEKHRRERGDLFETFEEPVELPTLLKRLSRYSVVVVDCLTTWLGNLYHYGIDVGRYSDELISSLNGNEVIVTNEVGLGVIGAEPLTRSYVESLGRLNARLARVADEVYMMIAGIEVRIK
ncbi:TPA: bifunctional adenosylcobinamide kinase/adenosylcobinamide-phosphate guanylyltransferase [Candidatus Poribacteria bacterium]|nr:bifunctional adenosylcobinamide kinase/adenosylcobinamide-phosphate guanylyltransferase [Candidatus Poribacteria bacterium]